MVSLVAVNFILFYCNAYVCVRHNYIDLTRYTVFTPLYWVLMSVGAWLGLLSLIRNPFYWAKTEHGTDLPETEGPAALAVGLGRRALEDSARYANDRQAFGKPIGEFQLIAAKLADMATELHAARLMTYDAAAQLDTGATITSLAAMTKLFATEACARIVDEATRIYGSYGFAMEYPAQRWFRDARFLLYGGGTSEILRGLIGRAVLGRQGRV